MWVIKCLIFLLLVAFATSQNVNRPQIYKRNRSIAQGISKSNNTQLENRSEDKGFIKDIIDRLNALDADIGKLLFNSTSMYTPNDQSLAFSDDQKGSEKFTEVLNDLDSLQDEIGNLVNNATKTRQYNILVRLRPLNTLLYRIRHNLHLMRNSLVAINAVSSLEKIGNSVLDSTLSVFMKPDANVNDELGDDGNYDFNLDKYGDANQNFSTIIPTLPPLPSSAANIASTTTPKSTTSRPTTTSTTTTTTTTTTTITTPAPKPTNLANYNTTLSVTGQVSTTKRPAQRAGARRPGQRRTSTPKSTTTPKPTNTTTSP